MLLQINNNSFKFKYICPFSGFKRLCLLITVLLTAILFLTPSSKSYSFSSSLFIEVNDLPSLSVAIANLDSVAINNLKNEFESATAQYLRALTSGLHTDNDMDVLFDDLKYVSLLNESDEKEYLNLIGEADLQEIGEQLQKIWNYLDPTPVTLTNERLIEHRIRVHEACLKYSNPDSPNGVDDRGLAYIKYGEPDKILTPPLYFSIGEINEFVTEFFLKLEEKKDIPMTDIGVRANKFTYKLIDYMGQVPFSSTMNIWVYQSARDYMDESIVLYFSEHDKNQFKRVGSIDDWIPLGQYRSGTLMISPALVTQYLIYRRLMFEDDVFMHSYNRIQKDLFVSNIPRSIYEWKNMARNLKANNHQIEARRQLQAPLHYSAAFDHIPEIPIDVNQYRSFDNNNQPILITFIETLPTVTFLKDLTLNLDSMFDASIDSIQIIHLISQWYSLEQGVELYNSDTVQVGRIRDKPIMHLENEAKRPTITITDIPYLGSGANQVFYSKLNNQHPESEPINSSIFPDELRGLGRVEVRQLDHLSHFEGEGDQQLVMSDLIFGYNRIDRDEARFPFIIKHDQIIPENQNPVVHFELFGLERDPSGFAHFEIMYQFEPKGGLLSFLRQTNNLLSGTLEFTTAATHFRESLEFDNLPLGKNNYTMTWVIKDLISGQELSRELEFKVEEGDQFTITSN